MKRLGLTLAAALVFSVSMFAEGVQETTMHRNGMVQSTSQS